MDDCYFKALSALQIDEINALIIGGSVAAFTSLIALCVARASILNKYNRGFVVLVVFAVLDNTTDVLYIISEAFYSDIIFWFMVAVFGCSLLSYVRWLFDVGVGFDRQTFPEYLYLGMLLIVGYGMHLCFLVHLTSIKHRLTITASGSNGEMQNNDNANAEDGELGADFMNHYNQIEDQTARNQPIFEHFQHCLEDFDGAFQSRDDLFLSITKAFMSFQQQQDFPANGVGGEGNQVQIEWEVDVRNLNKDRLFLFGRDFCQFLLQLFNTSFTGRFSSIAIISIATSGVNLSNFIWSFGFGVRHGISFLTTKPQCRSAGELTTCT